VEWIKAINFVNSLLSIVRTRHFPISNSKNQIHSLLQFFRFWLIPNSKILHRIKRLLLKTTNLQPDALLGIGSDTSLYHCQLINSFSFLIFKLVLWSFTDIVFLNINPKSSTGLDVSFALPTTIKKSIYQISLDQ